MFHLTFKKILSAGICGLLLSQTALASISESNVWAERRNGLNRQDHSANNNTLYAALPAALSTLGQFSTPPFADQSAAFTVNAKKFNHVSPKLKDLINAIPLTHSRIQEVYDNGDQSAAPVVIIQDIHLNPEAQSNIAVVLQELINQDQAALVGVEGAFKKINFSSLRKFPDELIKLKVARAFLDNKFLAAPSFVGLTSEKEPPVFLGVDDPAHHQANVDAYLSTRKTKDNALAELIEIKKTLNAAKLQYFSSELKEFDDLYSAHQAGNLGMGPYLQKLSQYGITPAFEIEQFLAAYGLELSLNFEIVDQERKRVIEKLAQNLDKGALQNFLSQSLSYKLGRLSFGDYTQTLKNLCRANNIDLRETPAFNNYIQYVLLSDSIKANQLFDAINQLEQEIAARLATDSSQKEIVKLSQHIFLISKLIDFQLTPAEWLAYAKNRQDLNSMQKALKIIAPLESPSKKFITDLARYEAFYEEAEIRSEIMVDHLSAYPVSGPRVLVTGGFHTPEIAQLLKIKKIPYVIVTPQITKIDNSEGSSYLSIFAREKTPLDRLFAGEKLFVNPVNVNVSNPALKVNIAATLLLLAQPLKTIILSNSPQQLIAAKSVPAGFHQVDQLMLSGLGPDFSGVFAIKSLPYFNGAQLFANINYASLDILLALSSTMLMAMVMGLFSFKSHKQKTWGGLFMEWFEFPKRLSKRIQNSAKIPRLKNITHEPKNNAESKQLQNLASQLNSQFGIWESGAGYKLFIEAEENLKENLRPQLNLPAEQLNEIYHILKDDSKIRELIINAISGRPYNFDSLTITGVLEGNSVPILKSLIERIANLEEEVRVIWVRNFNQEFENYENRVAQISQWDFIHRFPGSYSITLLSGGPWDPQAPYEKSFRVFDKSFLSYIPNYALEFTELADGAPVRVGNVQLPSILRSSFITIAETGESDYPEPKFMMSGPLYDSYVLHSKTIANFFQWINFKNAYQSLWAQTAGYSKEDSKLEIEDEHINALAFTNLLFEEFKTNSQENPALHSPEEKKFFGEIIDRTLLRFKGNYKETYRGFKTSLKKLAAMKTLEEVEDLGPSIKTPPFFKFGLKNLFEFILASFPLVAAIVGTLIGFSSFRGTTGVLFYAMGFGLVYYLKGAQHETRPYTFEAFKHPSLIKLSPVLLVSVPFFIDYIVSLVMFVISTPNIIPIEISKFLHYALPVINVIPILIILALGYFLGSEKARHRRNNGQPTGPFYFNLTSFQTITVAAIIISADILSKFAGIMFWPEITVFHSALFSNNFYFFQVLLISLFLLSIWIKIPLGLTVALAGGIVNSTEIYFWGGVIDPLPIFNGMANLADLIIYSGAALMIADSASYFKTREWGLPMSLKAIYNIRPKNSFLLRAVKINLAMMISILFMFIPHLFYSELIIPPTKSNIRADQVGQTSPFELKNISKDQLHLHIEYTFRLALYNAGSARGGKKSHINFMKEAAASYPDDVEEVLLKIENYFKNLGEKKLKEELFFRGPDGYSFSTLYQEHGPVWLAKYRNLVKELHQIKNLANLEVVPPGKGLDLLLADKSTLRELETLPLFLPQIAERWKLHPEVEAPDIENFALHSIPQMFDHYWDQPAQNPLAGIYNKGADFLIDKFGPTNGNDYVGPDSIDLEKLLLRAKENPRSKEIPKIDNNGELTINPTPGLGAGNFGNLISNILGKPISFFKSLGVEIGFLATVFLAAHPFISFMAPFFIFTHLILRLILLMQGKIKPAGLLTGLLSDSAIISAYLYFNPIIIPIFIHLLIDTLWFFSDHPVSSKPRILNIAPLKTRSPRFLASNILNILHRRLIGIYHGRTFPRRTYAPSPSLRQNRTGNQEPLLQRKNTVPNLNSKKSFFLELMLAALPLLSGIFGTILVLPAYSELGGLIFFIAAFGLVYIVKGLQQKKFASFSRPKLIHLSSVMLLSLPVFIFFMVNLSQWFFLESEYFSADTVLFLRPFSSFFKLLPIIIFGILGYALGWAKEKDRNTSGIRDGPLFFNLTPTQIQSVAAMLISLDVVFKVAGIIFWPNLAVFHFVSPTPLFFVLQFLFVSLLALSRRFLIPLGALLALSGSLLNSTELFLWNGAIDPFPLLGNVVNLADIFIFSGAALLFADVALFFKNKGWEKLTQYNAYRENRSNQWAAVKIFKKSFALLILLTTLIAPHFTNGLNLIPPAPSAVQPGRMGHMMASDLNDITEEALARHIEFTYRLAIYNSNSINSRKLTHIPLWIAASKKYPQAVLTVMNQNVVRLKARKRNLEASTPKGYTAQTFEYMYEEHGLQLAEQYIGLVQDLKSIDALTDFKKTPPGQGLSIMLRLSTLGDFGLIENFEDQIIARWARLSPAEIEMDLIFYAEGNSHNLLQHLKLPTRDPFLKSLMDQAIQTLIKKYGPNTNTPSPDDSYIREILKLKGENLTAPSPDKVPLDQDLNSLSRFVAALAAADYGAALNELELSSSLNLGEQTPADLPQFTRWENMLNAPEQLQNILKSLEKGEGEFKPNLQKVINNLASFEAADGYVVIISQPLSPEQIADLETALDKLKGKRVKLFIDEAETNLISRFSSKRDGLNASIVPFELKSLINANNQISASQLKRDFGINLAGDVFILEDGYSFDLSGVTVVPVFVFLSSLLPIIRLVNTKNFLKILRAIKSAA